MRPRFCCSPLLIGPLFALTLCNSICAQTLTEKLLSEDPVKLAQQARQDGDIVRGAILFHQGNISCVKCHRSTAEQNRFGPDLSKMDRLMTDEAIVESILQPSKKIKEGFETVVVLTSEGKTFSGINFSEDEKKLVIRDSQNIDELITIRKEELEDMRLGTTSSMPENLANELKNRQQFLDLLRYVFDIKERGPAKDLESLASQIERKLSPELQGFILVQEFNCSACHLSDSTLQSQLVAKQAPRLEWSAKKLNPKFIEQFIANPHGAKPGTTMPALLEDLDQSSKAKVAQAITHYLIGETGNDYRPMQTNNEMVSRGFDLFHSVGCVACHSPRNEAAVEIPFGDSIALGDLSQKYDIPGLTEFLEDPLKVRPSGYMPHMSLTHREAVDISNYLLQGAEVPDGTTWVVDSELAQQGQEFFQSFACSSCHTDFVDKPVAPSRTPFAKMNSKQGCLSDQLGDWPNFELEQSARELIGTYLESLPLEMEQQQQIDVTLAAFNCLACHDRNNMGGITSERNPHFQTTNLNLGDQGRIPPTLTGVGAKLNTKWMRDVLVNQRSVRPYMKTRMPQFGERNIGHLVQLFATTDTLPKTEFAQFDDQKQMREKGLELAGSKGLNCVACHTYKYKLSDTMPAVDLTEMAERLNKDWFYQYMLEPQKFSPNTVMPSFWPGGKAIRADIEGQPRDQIEALWQYLIDGRQARMPRGVVREPLEIVVTDEARMLRRSYPNVGKRGIGVGYPGGVNLVFDAEQMRLATLWQGKFIDPAGVWRGQGSGTARPLGRPIDFAKGPDFDDADEPWMVDDGRPPQHQFKGYVLDQKRRPVFRYQFGTILVEDFFAEQIDADSAKTCLRREVKITPESSLNGLRFRVASAKAIEKETDGTYLVGEQLRVQLVSDQQARVVDCEGGQQLDVMLDLKKDQRQTLILEYYWTK